METPSFADLGAPAEVCAALERRGIQTPTPVQALTIADGCAGRDVVAEAPTGSGKTIAFAVPLVARLGTCAPRAPRGLVLVPTRELAAQVRDELDWLGASRRLRVATLYGGVGMGPQRAVLRRGVDVVVACPGRLTDLLERGELTLREVEMVVVDEADRMADMGFLPAVRAILDLTPDSRQTLLFSATLEPSIADLWRRHQRDPARHSVATDRDQPTRATHLFWSVAREQRVGTCVDVVRAVGSTIVFCRTKRGADQVARKLAHLGVRTAAIHGNRSQGQRDRALRAFAGGELQALVATDVAARGVHVDDVACVVHWDPSDDLAAYVHRSGRTARAGADGLVISFVAHDQQRHVGRFQRQLGLSTRVVAPDTAALPPSARRGSGHLTRPERTARSLQQRRRRGRAARPRRASQPSGLRPAPSH
jgi:superfamily II DNA/RNA helicase